MVRIHNRTASGHVRRPRTPSRVIPRVLVVAHAETRQDNGTPEQSLDLVLLGRSASAEYRARFPDGPNGNRDQIVEYAESHAVKHLAREGSSRPHQVSHIFKGTNYHLGDVLTEREVADLGYAKPFIDTMCADMASIATNRLTHAVEVSPKLDAELTAAFREIGYLSPTQVAMLSSEQHSLRLDVADETGNPSELSAKLDESHPVRLLIHPESRPGQIRVICEVYDKSKEASSEFLTYIPGGT